MTIRISKAMVLAAGKGERMRPLTDTCPKPLLKIKGKALIEYSIEKLKRADVVDLVINISHLGQMIQDYLGDGSRYGVNIRYSWEDQPLETGGGIAKAMPLLCRDNESPFLLVNSDVWCDLDVSSLTLALKKNSLAHLVLVKNPEHNIKGDFSLQDNLVKQLAEARQGFTYSGIAVIDPQLFKRYQPNREKFPLRDLLIQAIQQQEVSGEMYDGLWVDVGTPERLQSLA